MNTQDTHKNTMLNELKKKHTEEEKKSVDERKDVESKSLLNKNFIRKKEHTNFSSALNPHTLRNVLCVYVFSFKSLKAIFRYFGSLCSRLKWKVWLLHDENMHGLDGGAAADCRFSTCMPCYVTIYF